MPPLCHWLCKYILGKSNEVFMVRVDVGLLNVNQKKNLEGSRGGCEYRVQNSKEGSAHTHTQMHMCKRAHTSRGQQAHLLHSHSPPRQELSRKAGSPSQEDWAKGTVSGSPMWWSWVQSDHKNWYLLLAPD